MICYFVFSVSFAVFFSGFVLPGEGMEKIVGPPFEDHANDIKGSVPDACVTGPSPGAVNPLMCVSYWPPNGGALFICTQTLIFIFLTFGKIDPVIQHDTASVQPSGHKPRNQAPCCRFRYLLPNVFLHGGPTCTWPQ